MLQFAIRMLLLLVVLVPVARADCEAHSTPERQHLVELYTSEGCDSCPPAERWMSTLLTHPEIVGLEFHVDYWDSYQWKDPFDSKSYTERQQMLAKRGNGGQYYSPQIWLDGRLWHNWPKGAPPSPYEGPSPSIKLEVDAGAGVHAHLDVTGPSADSADYRLYAALTENGLTSAIRGGENRGKKLSHDQVVRAFSGPLALPHAEVDLKLPPHSEPTSMSFVAFVQDERDGSVVQVLKLPLSECKN